MKLLIYFLNFFTTWIHILIKAQYKHNESIYNTYQKYEAIQNNEFYEEYEEYEEHQTNEEFYKRQQDIRISVGFWKINYRNLFAFRKSGSVVARFDACQEADEIYKKCLAFLKDYYDSNISQVESLYVGTNYERNQIRETQFWLITKDVFERKRNVVRTALYLE